MICAHSLSHAKCSRARDSLCKGERILMRNVAKNVQPGGRSERVVTHNCRQADNRINRVNTLHWDQCAFGSIARYIWRILFCFEYIQVRTLTYYEPPRCLAV